MRPKTYKQIAEGLRIHRPGQPDKVSNRPRVEATGQFLDLDNPTLITLEPDDVVDEAFLLRIGAIEELPEEPEVEVKHGKGK